MDPLIITVAAVGAELTSEQQPNLPIGPEALARDARECQQAGASIYHLHVRAPDGTPTMDVSVFEEALTAIRSETDIIVQFTTGGSVDDGAAARIAPLELRPEMATLTTGSVNFGDEVFLNPAPLVRDLYERMMSVGVLPEFEIFDAGMIANAVRLVDEGGHDHHLHFDFVLGVPGAMPAWEDSVGFLEAHLPQDATWSATGIGKAHLPVTREALARGGHIRTGLEDVRYFAAGEPARSNAQLIARVADLACAEGRELSDPKRTRELLGIAAV